jgi:hypothetical protein
VDAAVRFDARRAVHLLCVPLCRRDCLACVLKSSD